MMSQGWATSAADYKVFPVLTSSPTLITLPDWAVGLGDDAAGPTIKLYASGNIEPRTDSVCVSIEVRDTLPWSDAILGARVTSQTLSADPDADDSSLMVQSTFSAIGRIPSSASPVFTGTIDPQGDSTPLNSAFRTSFYGNGVETVVLAGTPYAAGVADLLSFASNMTIGAPATTHRGQANQVDPHYQSRGSIPLITWSLSVGGNPAGHTLVGLFEGLTQIDFARVYSMFGKHKFVEHLPHISLTDASEETGTGGGVVPLAGTAASGPYTSPFKNIAQFAVFLDYVAAMAAI
jgi:hypothetical protein